MGFAKVLQRNLGKGCDGKCTSGLGKIKMRLKWVKNLFKMEMGGAVENGTPRRIGVQKMEKNGKNGTADIETHLVGFHFFIVSCVFLFFPIYPPIFGLHQNGKMEKRWKREMISIVFHF